MRTDSAAYSSPSRFTTDVPGRTILALALMIAQAFLYNAIFFTEALVLKAFFAVPARGGRHTVRRNLAGNGR
jgi:hypothetical protein